MIGAIGEQAAASARPPGAEQGRRAEAVGQQAKAAVLAAREAGAELPKNAQGLAASGIARGADPASLFAALVTPVAEGDSAGDVGGVPTTDGNSGDVGGSAPTSDADNPVVAAPPAPLAPPPPPSVADDDGGEETSDVGDLIQVAVSDPTFSVDDGSVALELLTTASPN